MNKRAEVKRVVGFVFVGLVVVTAFAVYQIGDREPRLLARSRRLTVREHSNTDYYWTSGQTLLALAHSSTGYIASTVNVFDGKTTFLPSLTRQLKQIYISSSPSLSPNRQWLLAELHLEHTQLGFAISVDGGQSIPWAEKRTKNARKMSDPYFLSPPVWCADDTHWLEFTPNDGKGRCSIIRHGVGEKDVQLGKTGMSGCVLGVANRGELLVLKTEVTGQAQEVLLVCDPERGTKVGSTTLPIGAGETLTQILVSPAHDRLAFVTSSGGELRYPQWLADHLNWLERYTRPRNFKIWICGLDGKGLREIGCVVEDEVSKGIGEIDWGYNSNSLDWLPDGKSLSFVLGGSIWIAPVN